MRKLLLITLLLVSLGSFAQEKTTFIMTSAKNEVCKRTSTKWITVNRTYDDIEIEVRDGIVYMDTKGGGKYTPIEKSTEKMKDGFIVFSVMCRDKDYIKCEFAMYKGDDGIVLCTIEYNDYKYFYYRDK